MKITVWILEPRPEKTLALVILVGSYFFAGLGFEANIQAVGDRLYDEKFYKVSLGSGCVHAYPGRLEVSYMPREPGTDQFQLGWVLPLWSQQRQPRSCMPPSRTMGAWPHVWHLSQTSAGQENCFKAAASRRNDMLEAMCSWESTHRCTFLSGWGEVWTNVYRHNVVQWSKGFVSWTCMDAVA